MADAESGRRRSEAGFEAWGRFVVHHRRLVVMLGLLVTVALGSVLPQLRVDNSTESFFHPEDPAVVVYNDFRDRFDRDDLVVVGLAPPEVFDLAFLEQLRKLHREIEAAVPFVQEVTSLVNARATYGRGDELVVEDLLETWPQNAADLATLRARVFENPFYRNTLVSEDGRFTTLTIKPDTYSSIGVAEGGFDDEEGEAAYLSEAEEVDLVRTLRQVAAHHEGRGFEIYLSGGSLMNVTLNERMLSDVNLFMVVTTSVMALILALLFRRASGVLLPLMVVISALIATLGIMVLIDVPLSVVIQILPAFLLAVGICDSVHLLVIIYQRMSEGDTKHDAIVYALGHSGLAVMMTSVTTAGGLVSFIAADLAPVADLGIVAPIGVMLAFFYSVTLLPALVAVCPIKASSRAERHAGGRISERLLMAIGAFASHRPRLVLSVTAGVLVVAAVGIAQVRFSHDVIRWFPEDDALRVAAETLNEALGGVATLELLIDTGRENGLHEPAVLERIDRSMQQALAYESGGIGVASAVSIVNVVKETHRALNENRASHYALPESRALVAQELLLFENSGSDDLDDVVSTDFREARLTLRMPWVDAVAYPVFIGGLETQLRETLGPDTGLQVTGMGELLGRAFGAVIRSMTRSYILALAIITPMLVLLIGNLRRGLVAMIPNLIPVVLVLGLMGWRGIPLDGSTLMVGAIVIGLAVDDTIHFMHKFSRYLEDGATPAGAVRETLRTTGSALLFTSLVLAAGFSSFLFAYMENAQWFGLLVAFATLAAFVADVLVGPALMVLVTRKEVEWGAKERPCTSTFSPPSGSAASS